MTKEHRPDKKMQYLQTYDNHALSRCASKITHLFSGQKHTLDLQVWIFIQYPIGSASKTGVLVLPPSKAAKIFYFTRDRALGRNSPELGAEGSIPEKWSRENKGGQREKQSHENRETVLAKHQVK